MRLPRRTRLRIVGTVVSWLIAAMWVLVPHRWEGRVVFTITGSHGVHAHDVLGVAAAVLVTAALWVTPAAPRGAPRDAER